MTYLYIFIGGAIGALLRFSLSTLNHDSTFPIGTLVANLIGALLMGLFTAISINLFNNHPTLKKAITTGLLGALTTFSTFQVELVQMMEQHQFLLSLCYALTSYIFGILLCYCGMKIGGKIKC
ncbi:fluoride efflux transporter CrcB [Staphylococcus simiae]|uniref:Fluoride-specific ion channel FluC n=1 Tax=Staphylococcus simiae CCM 7213 = CCUG 51256 TaxID=911238 RepID=G5JJC1_9STAP|nr:fluoride efflux transporter CrcB [Staphylococcus simiae]EHJ07690.1 camphor resistance protein CrcB [Staphylococcus simiae CCM 7213 = CCUG 51256]PNZ13573.1 fluoride efflux transporter CrcB [Staphylococcus simiae]SNV75149.1 CrcB family protein [Staphylococcus simiae]